MAGTAEDYLVLAAYVDDFAGTDGDSSANSSWPPVRATY